MEGGRGGETRALAAVARAALQGQMVAAQSKVGGGVEDIAEVCLGGRASSSCRQIGREWGWGGGVWIEDGYAFEVRQPPWGSFKSSCLQPPQTWSRLGACSLASEAYVRDRDRDRDRDPSPGGPRRTVPSKWMHGGAK